MEITFEQLPKAVSQLFTELEHIKQLLLQQNSSAPAESDTFLNVREAAALVNLAVPTVYSMVSQGTIPYSKKAHRLYFSKQDLLNWIRSGKKQTQAEIVAEAEAELATAGRRGSTK